MPLRSKRNFKVQIGATDLTLEAKTGESFLINDVKIYSAAITYANFLIERASVGFYRIDEDNLGSHLPFNPGRSAHAHDLNVGAAVGTLSTAGALLADAGDTDSAVEIAGATADTNIERAMLLERTPSSFQETLLAYLRKKGIFKGFPVAEGETFTIDLVTGAGDIKLVEYDIYDAGDITNVMENGAKAAEYMYISYGDAGASIQATALNKLTQSNNPAEYPDFPFNAAVPSGHKIELIGILASDVAPKANDGSAFSYTDYLRLMRGREVLFDEDHKGLLYYNPDETAEADMDMIGEGFAVGGNYTQVDRKQPLLFDPPILFNEGEELTVSWHLGMDSTPTGAAITQVLHEIGMILRLSPM